MNRLWYEIAMVWNQAICPKTDVDNEGLAYIHNRIVLRNYEISSFSTAWIDLE